jgi:hypothetical protein
MIFKRFLVLAFLLCYSAFALAADTTIRGVHGSWWNPAYAGEGFALEQYDDGLMIVYWYTYDEAGNQIWLIGTGYLNGNHIDLEMSRTEGGLMASQQNPGMVSEELWGMVSLDLLGCKEIDMSFEAVDGRTGGYKLGRIVDEGLAGSLCDEPETAKLKLQQLSPTGSWKDVALPYKGLIVIDKTYAGNDGSVRPVHLQFRLVSLDGEFTVIKVVASDPTHGTSPAVEGVFEGQVIPNEGVAVIRLVSNLTGKRKVTQNYQVHVRDIGEVLNLDVALTTN